MFPDPFTFYLSIHLLSFTTPHCQTCKPSLIPTFFFFFCPVENTISKHAVCVKYIRINVGKGGKQLELHNKFKTRSQHHLTHSF